MKRAIAFICSVCMMLCLFSCQSNGNKLDNDIILNKDKSLFSDFKIIDDKVYIYCTLFIDNRAGSNKDIKIKALFENDAKIGLLKEAALYGCSVDKNSGIFNLEQGENQIDIVFIGQYAGTPKKVSRALPTIEIIEI